MAAKEAFLPVGVTTEKLDTTKVTQKDGTVVHREAVFLASPSVNDGRIEPEPFNIGSGKLFSLPTTGVELRSLVDLMGRLLDEQRLTNLHLSRLTGEPLTIDDVEDY